MGTGISSVVATVLVFIFYLLAANSVKSQWEHKLLINPLKITTEANGRASLSKTQVFFFTLIVAWLSIYWIMEEGKLVPLNDSIIMLLGIAAGGAGLGRVAGAARFQVTGVNLAWTKKKKWIEKDLTRVSLAHRPKFSDLFTSDQGFEVSRFQAVVFSVIIGGSLMYNGIMIDDVSQFESFSIPSTYLALIGLSQGVYVGGKVVGTNFIPELNSKLDKLRELELAFTTAVLQSPIWQNASTGERDLWLAREKAAPSQYTTYMQNATEAAEIVNSLTGNKIDSIRIQPELPPV
ncbi:MAG: hypothetical protein OXC62_13520 [Aestuariivita sp.]|nr:hypothetical protein [Aestuariivita sp.]